jgi:hypothetical protein
MARLMSVAFTEDAVRDRTKTVTRRKGWTFAKPGDRITLCRKVMGRKKGEPLERIVDVELVDVRREPLTYLGKCACWADHPDLETYAQAEVRREGFPGMDPDEFVRRFFVDAQGMARDAVVTRLEWRYLDAPRCPECQQGKCGNCDGTSWDETADQPIPCPCTHGGA